MADRYRGGLYTGVSADLIARVHAHREGRGSRHVADFDKTCLVYAERHEEIETAIAREKLVKKWRRQWKFALIEAENPDWRDLWNVRYISETSPKNSGGPCQARGDENE